MTKSLSELKKSFQPYSLLWNEWSKYRFCGLTEEDIYIIQIHSTNNFRYIEYDVIMFYNRPEKIFEIIQKLNSGYGEFQEWVVAKFSGSLMNIAVKEDFHSFFEEPIERLNISEELKQYLLNLGFVRLIDFIDTLSDADLKDAGVFKNIVNFLSIYFKEDNLFLMRA